MTGSTKPEIWEHIQAGRLGLVHTPGAGYVHRSGTWAADNGCFGKGYPGDKQYLAWLAKMVPHQSECLFATCPDVVGDHEATTARSRPFFEPIRALGYKACFVLQDGATPENVPWEEFDAAFIGGTDEFKLGPDAAACAVEAKRRGMHLHMGRVNSRKRCLYAMTLGCDSVDGTVLAFDPARLDKVLRWTLTV